MDRYDYHESMKEDIFEYIFDSYTREEIETHLADRETFEEKLHDELWVCDGVTGNASGSYTFSTWDAEENLCHNWGLLQDALDEFGCDYADALNRGAEYCDVTIRCYLLGSVIYQVLNELQHGIDNGTV